MFVNIHHFRSMAKPVAAVFKAKSSVLKKKKKMGLEIALDSSTLLYRCWRELD